MTQLALKKGAIFFVILNGTWALIAYLLYRVGVPFRAIAFALCIGVILGNVAVITGIRLAAKILGRSRHSE